MLSWRRKKIFQCIQEDGLGELASPGQPGQPGLRGRAEEEVAVGGSREEQEVGVVTAEFCLMFFSLQSSAVKNFAMEKQAS